MAGEWTEITYLERNATDTGMIVFVLSVMFVFLVLAALYESWSLPLAVILVVPMCVLCSITGVWIAKMDINVFTQIGFVVLIGLACKNAILIVEFAKLRREEGVDRREATLHACELRLRPILMTSFAFILGVVPLVISHGAGAEMRQALGTAVFSGMLGVTAFGIVFTPVFFFVIDAFAETHVLSHPRTHRAARIALDILRLKWFFAGLAAGFRWISEVTKRKPRLTTATPSRNGTPVRSHAGENGHAHGVHAANGHDSNGHHTNGAEKERVITGVKDE
jgi:multidrug efflux pump